MVTIESSSKTEILFSDEDLRIMKYLGNLDSHEIEKIKCFMSLPNPAITKLERVNSSIQGRVSEEAEYAKHDGRKILFKRAARETLPFLVYVMYISSLNYLNVFEILNYDGQKLYIGTIVLFFMLIFPLILFYLSAKLYHEKLSELSEKTDT